MSCFIRAVRVHTANKFGLRGSRQVVRKITTCILWWNSRLLGWNAVSLGVYHPTVLSILLPSSSEPISVTWPLWRLRSVRQIHIGHGLKKRRRSTKITENKFSRSSREGMQYNRMRFTKSHCRNTSTFKFLVTVRREEGIFRWNIPVVFNDR